MRNFLLSLLAVLLFSTSYGQARYWTLHSETMPVAKHKQTARASFPKEFKVFDLNVDALRQELFQIVGANPARRSTIISLPNAAGQIEQFEVFEASNFVPELQARFPLIRAFSGKGITDPASMLKLSVSPQGIQTILFRAGTANEYIEPYSADNNSYAVFQAQRNKGALPWVCSTPDRDLAIGLNRAVQREVTPEADNGVLKTMRLAQSVTAEYSNYFGATSAAQSGLVLAAVNATLTRTNGCYEKDLAIHLNLIANTTSVFYYDPATDPYSPPAQMGQWNNQLQSTLTSVIGESNYDIGHLFGASGGGGNAGCIGCVCVDGQKGRGITSPADGIPQGDNFDIDYVAHEVGHQMGGNHTFSHALEGTGVNKEVGAGITIMGYAGITSYDPAPHSIDIFHEATIQQIQNNMAGKTCPVSTSLAATNATPVVATLTNYTIPITTPFELTGSATDANTSDVLTYCWEQDDNATTSGANSVASPTKATGPNWLSFPATTNPTRIFPRLSTVLAGNSVTGPLPGGDAVCNIEALSSVARTLNFRLTVRDNVPYSSTAPIKVGQTAYKDMTITVSSAVGPFLITSQNTAVTWTAGTTETITWSVNGTTGAPTNTANVDIFISTDGGNTFSLLLGNTPNDGTESISVPNTPSTTVRVKVKAVGNVYMDINNANLTIIPPPFGFIFGSTTAATASCPAPASMSVTLPVNSAGGYNNPVTLSTTSTLPAGTTVSFGTNPVTPTGSSVVTLNGTNTLNAGTYTVTVQGVGTGASNQSATLTFTVNPGSGPAITGQPADQSVCIGQSGSFSVTSSGTYQWQVSTDGGTTWSNIGSATATSYSVTGAANLNNNKYRCIVTGQCGSTTSSAATLTVNPTTVINSQPTSLALCQGSSATFSVTAAGAGLSYVWQLSTDAGANWNPISGANAASYNIPAVTTAQNNYQYRCVVTGTCGSATSNAATLQVSANITISTQPASQTVCEATNISFTSGAAGSGIAYQWQVSTDGGTTWNNINNGGVYSGATAATLNITGVLPTQNGYRFRAVASNGTCTPGISDAATLTVNTFPSITTQPQSVAVCEGGNATFSVAASTGVGVLSYQWQFSTNGITYTSIPGATSASYAITGAVVGQNNYVFRVVVTAGCGSVTSALALLTVNPYPIVSFSPQSTICKSDNPITLSATPSGGTFSGAGVTGTTFNPTVAGVGAKAVNYSVTVAGCTSSAVRTILVNECAERHLTIDKYPAIIVYPSPNNGNFNIGISTDIITYLDIRIYNALGQLIKSQTASGLRYGSVIPVNISGQPSGTYQVYMINDQSGKVTTKATSIVVYR
ncbi:MAG: reprolysin-like metallopeptidase [Bacteroidota bacterium]